MPLKEKIENNAAIFLLGALVTGFLAGVSTYQAILKIAKLEVVHESSLRTTGRDGQVTEIVNKFIGDFKNEGVDENKIQYALLKIGKSATKPLINALKSKEQRVREKAAYLLGEIKDESAIEALKLTLRNDKPYVRKIAAEALGEIGGKAVITPLQMALNDESADAREGAAYALGKIKAYDTKGDLKRVLLEDKDPNVRAQAARALGELQYFQGEAYFIKLLNDKNIKLKAAAIFALGKIKCKKVVNVLISALKDPSHEVRNEAARALGEIGDPNAIEPLQKLMSNEKDFFVKSSIEISLRQLGNK